MRLYPENLRDNVFAEGVFNYMIHSNLYPRHLVRYDKSKYGVLENRLIISKEK